MNNVRNLLTGSLVYIACIVLLSLACNVSSGLPVADVIGQWLYFDKSALVVAGCLLMAGLMMEKRYFLFIPVSWVLVMLGGIEAVDYVLLDDNDKCIGNVYGYRDERTDGMDEEVYKVISEKELYSRTAEVE